MPKNTTGPNKRFEFRPGINFPDFAGMSQPQYPGAVYAGDPGKIPANKFIYLQNVRFVDGNLVSRGGQTKVNTDAEDGCVVGIWDDRNSLLSGLTFLARHDNPGDPVLFNFNPLTGEIITCVGDVNFTITSLLTEGPDATTDTLNVDPTYYVLGNGSSAPTSNALKFVGYTAGSTNLLTLSFEQAFVSGVLAGAPTPMSGAFDGTNLYIGIGEASGHDGVVYKWNGTTLTLEDTPAQPFGVYVFVDHAGEILSAYNNITFGLSAPTFIRRRNSGTWSSVSLPGGITDFSCTSVATYGGATYIAGWKDTTTLTGYILKWDGSALTTVTGPLDTRVQISLTEFNGDLYYLYSNWVGGPVSPAALMLGKFDGTTWDDNFLDLSTVITGLPTASDTITGLRSSHGSLCIVVSNSTVGTEIYTSSNGSSWQTLVANTDLRVNTGLTLYNDTWLVDIP